MKTKIATTCIVLGALFSPVLVHAADRDSDRTSASTYVEDSVITTKIKAKLAGEKMSSLTRIKVDTDRQGVVTLSGMAKSKEEADRAVSLARETDGVTSVKSNIQIDR